jgi:hypothetical protein
LPVALIFDIINHILATGDFIMPNWCTNSLQLTAATKEEADELSIHLKKLNEPTKEGEKEPTFFGFFVPETWDDKDWYWNRVEAWGTKWDASMHDWAWVDDTTVVLNFDTAWSPPIEAYEAMAEQGWLVSATYYEPGMCFVGSWNDEVGSEHYDYADCDTPEAVRELVGDELDDEYGISDWMEQMLEEEKQIEAEE